MRPLNRPMFKYGGPIKEGIMSGMKEPQAINTVGNNANRDAMGREKHALFIPFLGAAAMNAARMLAPRAIAAGAKAFGRGVMTKAPGTSPFASGITGMQRLRNLLPTGRFLQPATPTGQKIAGKYVPAPLRFREAIKSPEAIGRAVRENPAAAFVAAGQIKNAPEIIGGGLGLAADTALGGVNYLLGTDFERGKKGDDIKTTEGGGIKRGGKTTTVPTPEVTGEVKDVKTEAEKTKINEDRIQETKNKYYKLMGIDKMNKDAVYDSLIDASRIVSEEGGDLKGSIKSGNLQNRLIQAIGKNLDKSADLKKSIDAAVLKGEIQKDINLTKPSAFAEQVDYIRNNPNDPLAKKLSGMTSVADNLAALADKPITSDIVQRLVESKGTEVKGGIKDDKYQKWEKNNEGRDEIDYLQDVYKGQTLDEGIYIVNKKAIRIDGEGNAFPVDLDSIIG
tara:strand:+ start:796 stop:2145 length:1350 start_codon:yes stop_codon:yes gene_type:complete